MDEKKCKNCGHSKDVKYRQIICGKTGNWESELYSCPWWKAKQQKENK